MAYEHLNKVSYKSLTRTMQTQPPYKGSEQWPLGNRKYSRLFFVQKEGVFYLYDMNNKAYRLDTEQAAKWRESRLLAKVRPDNSYEFINAAHMGDKCVHTALCGMLVQNRATHGGGIVGTYRPRTGGWNKQECDAKHPLFEGLRIDLETEEATTPYVLHYRKPIKKLHAIEMDKYAAFLQMYPIMLQSTTKDGLSEMVREILHIPEGGEHSVIKEFAPRFHDVLAAIEQGHYLDAAILFGKTEGVWTGMWASRHTVSDHYARNLTSTIEKCFKKAALRANNDLFQMTLRKEGETLAACKWGYHIELKQGDLLQGYAVTRI